MNKHLKIFLIVTSMSFSQLHILAQMPNYSGRWRLNFQKSQLEHRPTGLTGSVFIIKQEDNKFRLTRFHIFGNKEKKISFRMISDGKTRRIKLLFKGKLEWKENILLATLWRKNFLNVVNYKYGSSQNEFIADEVLTSKPNNHHNVWVFDREILKEIPEAGGPLTLTSKCRYCFR